MSLGQRSVKSISWIVLGGMISYPVSLVQSIVLARLLPIETFGVFVGLSSMVALSYVVFDFGLAKAFIHRSSETMNEDRAAQVLFTMRLIFDTAWVILLIWGGLVFFSGERQTIFLVLVLSGYFLKFTITPRSILIRRVQHRRLAILDLSASLTSAFFSMLIAWYTQSVWALLISSIIGAVFGIGGLYFFKPFWRPRISWGKPILQYFLSFGGKNLINDLLNSAIENLDYLWSNYFLGERLLGFYSKAYKFSTYPRMILASPITIVLFGTFAELKFDRRRLSQAFFRSCVFLTRTGFLIAGGLAVIAPEFIKIFLGERWLPILIPFRLMLIFALLDPIRMTVGEVLVAVGKPHKVSVIRTIQLLILVTGLFLLGIPLQVPGVALTMDLMSIGGAVIALYFIRDDIDFSLRRLILPPLFPLAFGMGLTWALMNWWNIESLWGLLLVKGSLFSISYLATLFAIEGKELYQTFIRIVDFKAFKHHQGE